MSTHKETNFGTIEDFKANRFQKRYVFISMNYNANPAMTGVHWGISYKLPGTATVFDPNPKKGSPRMRNIRYIPGAQTIWEDEMEYDKVEDMRRQTQDFLFVRAHTNSPCELVVDGTDMIKLKYLMTCPYNFQAEGRDKEKPFLFYLLDMNAATQKMAGGVALQAKTINWCFTAEWDEVYAYARILLGDVSGQDSDQVRYNLYVIAQRDPIKFEAGLKSDLTKKKFLLIEALEKGILKRTQNTLMMADGTPISIAPVGKDPIDTLVDQNDAAATIIFADVRKRVYGEKKQNYKTDAPGENVATKEEVNELKATLAKQTELIEAMLKHKGVDDMNFNKNVHKSDTPLTGSDEPKTAEQEFDIWKDGAVAAGLFEQRGSWFYFEKHPVIKEFKQEKIQGLKELAKLLYETRPELMDAIKHELTVAAI